LLRGFLKGDLPKLLASLKPVPFGETDADDPMTAARSKSYASKGMSGALACHLAKSLSDGRNPVPGAQCEVSDGAEELAKRCINSAHFGESLEGTGIEALPSIVAGMRPKDAAFGRLFVTFDWHTCCPVDARTFQVPVTAAGKCPWHPHPISYVQTTEDDMFVVIIPFAGVADVPREEEAFAACTEMLRSIQPLDPPPVSSVRLSSFCATVPMRITEIDDGSAVRQKDGKVLHVAEFGSLSLAPGRSTPGRLLPAQAAASLLVEKPYILGFWHAGLDALNVPLAATLVA